MGQVIALGELLLRLSPPGRQIIVQAQSLDIEVGGAEANVLSGLAALGHECAMLSMVPDNPLGRLATATLRARAIDTKHVGVGPGRMGLYFHEAGQGARASAITYDRAGSAMARATLPDFDIDAALDGARLLHLSGITPALGPASSALALSVARSAQGRGIPISFDGNYRAQLWSAWDSDPRGVLSELIGMATVLFGNHRDISLVLDRSFSGDGPNRRREAADAAFAAFPALKVIASTARHVVDADHHRISARVDMRDAHAETATIDVTGIVDRIGTGDAFASGVLHQWLLGGDADAMAQNGLALGVLKHSLPGDMCLFNQNDIDAFLTGTRDVRR